MRNYSIDDIISVCEEYGMKNADALMYYSVEDLSTWYKTLKSVPYEILTGTDKYSQHIRTCINSLGTALNNNRRMLYDHKAKSQPKQPGSPYYTPGVKRHVPLTKRDINRSFHRAAYMLFLDTWTTIDGKTCVGKRPEYTPYEKAMARRMMWDSILPDLNKLKLEFLDEVRNKDIEGVRYLIKLFQSRNGGQKIKAWKAAAEGDQKAYLRHKRNIEKNNRKIEVLKEYIKIIEYEKKRF